MSDIYDYGKIKLTDGYHFKLIAKVIEKVNTILIHISEENWCKKIQTFMSYNEPVRPQHFS